MRKILVIGEGLNSAMLAMINRELTERNMDMEVSMMPQPDEQPEVEVLTSASDSSEPVMDYDPVVIGVGNCYPTLTLQALGEFHTPELWVMPLPVTRQERRQMWHQGQHHEARRQQSLMARARRR